MEEADDDFWQRVGTGRKIDFRDKMMKKNGIHLFLNTQINENECSSEY